MKLFNNKICVYKNIYFVNVNTQLILDKKAVKYAKLRIDEEKEYPERLLPKLKVPDLHKNYMKVELPKKQYLLQAVKDAIEYSCNGVSLIFDVVTFVLNNPAASLDLLSFVVQYFFPNNKVKVFFKHPFKLLAILTFFLMLFGMTFAQFFGTFKAIIFAFSLCMSIGFSLDFMFIENNEKNIFY